MGRKEEIKTQIRRLNQELDRLQHLPDGDVMRNGTVLAVSIQFPGGDRTYHYVALKAGGRWYFTGNGPHRATWDEVSEWLVRPGRQVVAIAAIAELELVSSSPNPVTDLGDVLYDMATRAQGRSRGLTFDDVYGVGGGDYQ